MKLKTKKDRPRRGKFVGNCRCGLMLADFDKGVCPRCGAKKK